MLSNGALSKLKFLIVVAVKARPRLERLVCVAIRDVEALAGALRPGMGMRGSRPGELKEGPLCGGVPEELGPAFLVAALNGEVVEAIGGACLIVP